MRPINYPRPEVGVAQLKSNAPCVDNVRVGKIIAR